MENSNIDNDMFMQSLNCDGQEHDDDEDETDKPAADEQTLDSRGCIAAQQFMQSVNCDGQEHEDDDDETDKPAADEQTLDSQGCIPVKQSVNCDGQEHDDDDETDKPAANEQTSDSQGCIPVQQVKEKGRKPGSVSAIPDDQYNFIIGILEGQIQLSSISKNERTKAQKAAIMRLWRNKGLLQVAKVHNPVTGKKEKRLISRKDERIILRESERAVVTKKYHQNYKGNGARRLFGVVRDSFIGCSRQSIQSDLKKFKDSQERKFEPSVINSLPPPIEMPKVPQERHQIELVSLEALPVEHRAMTYRYVLVVLDVFAKFMWLRPVARKDSVEILDHLSALYGEYGPPQEILFDHGEDCYDAIKQMCVDSKIEPINSVATQRQCEETSDCSYRLWKEKITFDLFQFAKGSANWVAKLPSYQLSQNEEGHRSLGMLTPFELYFGRTSNTMLSKMCLGGTCPEIDIANVNMKLENEFSHEALDQIQQSSGTPAHNFANNHFMENILKRISTKSSSDFKALHAFINTHLKLSTSKDSVDTMRDDLIAHAMELGYFERGDTPRDGNCLFHVLVDQLSRARVNSRLDHRQLRHQLVDHLRRNPTTSDGEHLQSFLYGMTWEEYLSRMEEDEWGDQFILQAFSNLYQGTVHVISSLGGSYNYVVTPTVGTPRGQELLLGHIFERHYISLEPLDSLSPENSPMSVLQPVSDNTTDTHVVVQQVETSYEDVLQYFAEEDRMQKRSRVTFEREESTPTSGFTRICTRGARSRFFLDFMNESGRQYTTIGTVALVPEEDIQIYNGIDDVIGQSLSEGDWIEEICPPFIYWVTRVRSWTQPVQRLSANVAILLHAECDEYRSWCHHVKDIMPHVVL